MSILKKTIIVLLLAANFFVPSFALAQDYGIGTTADTAGLSKTTLSNKTIPGLVGDIVAAGLSLIGIVFFILALYAGFVWMTAFGNTEKVTKAKDILEAAAIGLVIVLAAYAISKFVFTSLVNPPPPFETVQQNNLSQGSCTNGNTCIDSMDAAICKKAGGTPSDKPCPHSCTVNGICTDNVSSANCEAQQGTPANIECP